MKKLPGYLTIHPDSLLSDISGRFNEIYPNLKLVFFSTPDPGNPLSQKIIRSRYTMVKRFSFITGSVEIDITPQQTVTDVIAEFERSTGLKAGILRKADLLWINTSLTQNWSLEKQQEEAKLL